MRTLCMEDKVHGTWYKEDMEDKRTWRTGFTGDVEGMENKEVMETGRTWCVEVMEN